MYIIVDLCRRFFVIILAIGFLTLYAYDRTTRNYRQPLRPYYAIANISPVEDYSDLMQYNLYSSNKPTLFKDNINLDRDKYVLIWVPNKRFNALQQGKTAFIENKCEFTNCYITNNRSYFQDSRHFDAIIFSIYSISDDRINISNYPKHRKESPWQKFIFAGLEPATRLTVTHSMFDNFFHWTWTYRLDSDILWRYYLIHDTDGKVVGPRTNMTWRKSFEPTPEAIKPKLWKKTKTVAWIASECVTRCKRELYVHQLKNALRKYGLSLDVFGGCGHRDCKNMTECLEIVEKDYLFLLALESDFEQDYVTEEVLNAMQHLVVPIVRGGAEYSRFLPPGSYLDSKSLSIEQMAETIADLTINLTAYDEYFKWRNHYTYKPGLKSEICNLCKALNDEDMIKKKTVHKSFRRWWWSGTKRKRQILERLQGFHVNKVMKDARYKYFLWSEKQDKYNVAPMW